MSETSVRTWPQFVSLVGERADTVPAYPQYGAYRDHRVHAAFVLFFELSRGERFDILEDALAGPELISCYRQPITRGAVDEYQADERCGEDDAFINLAAWSVSAALDAVAPVV
jgi:hypothetical protein